MPGSAIATGGVGTTQLADDAVTAAKLGNESTVDLVTTLPATGAFTGQLALDTDDLKVYCWDGSTWQSIKAAGSINAVVGGSTGIVNITVTTSGDTVTINTTLDNTSAAAQFLAGPTAAAGAVSYRTIAAGDLPTATTGAKGAVQVNGNGLSMSGDTIQIANTVTANSSVYHLVQYTSKGLVSGGRTIQSGDLPLAGASTVGAVYPGSGLTVAVDGQINHSASVTPGTSPKVTYNAQGHITGGESLVAADIPDIPATKLTSGTLDVAVIGNNTITGAKLANYSTVRFGGASSTSGIVTFPVPEFTGQQFFDSTNGDLYIYDGNTWQPITVISGDLVYAGTYNAATNTVKSVTTQGSAVGLVVGLALPAASAANIRYYVVVADSGNGVSPAPAVALAPPDMIISNGATWDLVDVSNAIAGQIATNISFTPYAGLVSTNVQTALQELEDEKLAKIGGTVTGNLEIGTTGSLTFEGSTADGFETTLGVVDPTGDRTILLPNVSGTLITTGDSGVVTSTMIADGTIVNADVNASAAIAGTKISPDFGGQNVTTTGLFVHTGGSATTPTITFSGDTNTGIYSPGADQLAISTSGTGRLFVASDGKVGVGTSSPSSLLHVQNPGPSAGGDIIIGATGINGGTSRLSLYGATNYVGFRHLNVGSGDDLSYVEGGPEALGVNNAGYLAFGTRNVSSTLVERLRITGDGKVGIGTSSPGFTLDCRGAGKFGDAAKGAFLGVDANIPYIQGYDSAGTYNQLKFITGAAEAMRITSDGKVGVGTSSPAAKLHVQTIPQAISQSGSVLFGPNTSYGFEIRNVIDSSGYPSVEFRGPIIGDAPILFNTGTGSTERLRITGDGKVGIGTSSPTEELNLIGDIALGVDAHVNQGTYTIRGGDKTTGIDAFSAVSVQIRAGNAQIGGGGGAAGDLILSAGNATKYEASNGSAGDVTIKAGTVTTGGFGGNVNPGVVTVETAGSERARIDSSGRLLVGTSSSRDTAIGGAALQVEGTTYGSSSIQMICDSAVDATTCSHLAFGRTKTTSIGGTGQVINGDRLGAISWNGAQNSTLSSIAGLIECYVDGEVQTAGDTTDMPGRLVFSTTADGASSPTERLRIASDGKVGIGTSSPGANLHISSGGNTETIIDASSGSPVFTMLATGAGGGLFGYQNFVRFGTVTGAAGAGFSEHLRIDSSGRLLVGTSSYDGNARAVFVGNTSDNATGAVDIRRNTARPTSADTQIGALRFISNDNTSSNYSYASIDVFTDGASSSNTDIPGRLVFSTTADGASSPTERLRISSTGRVTLANSSVGTPTALTDAATIAVDLALANHFTVTLGGNRTLGAPTNVTAGQSGVIVITQDGSGSKTLAYNSIWKFPSGTAPTLTTAANAVDILVFYVESATRISARLISDTK